MSAMSTVCRRPFSLGLSADRWIGAKPAAGIRRLKGTTSLVPAETKETIAMSNSTLDARSPVLTAVRLIDAEASPVDAGIVAVTVVRPRRRLRHRQARCTCGWMGRRRWILKAAAAIEAWSHAYAAGCAPREPLVVEATDLAAGAR